MLPVETSSGGGSGCGLKPNSTVGDSMPLLTVKASVDDQSTVSACKNGVTRKPTSNAVSELNIVFIIASFSCGFGKFLSARPGAGDAGTLPDASVSKYQVTRSRLAMQ